MFHQTGHVYHQDIHFDNEFPQSRSTPGTQAILSLSEIIKRGSSRGKPYQLSTNSNVLGQNIHESGAIQLNQVPSTGQQHYPSCSLRRNGRNGDRSSCDPPGNGEHYPHSSGGGCGGAHGTPGGGDGGPL